MHNTVKSISVLLVVSVLAVSACGGGGQPGTTQATTTTNVSGVVVAGSAFSSGNIVAYDYSSGTKANIVATAIVGADGHYQFTYSLSAPPSALLIEASNGCYSEVSYTFNGTIPNAPATAAVNPGNPSDVPVCLTGTLDAIVTIAPGAKATVSVTPYTHAAVGLIQYKVRNGLTVANAIAETTTAFRQLLGFDPVTTVPAMPQQSQTVSDSTVYGGLIAAIPGWLFNVAVAHQTYGTPVTLGTLDLTTLSFAAAMQTDLIEDGVFNGVGRDSNGNATSLAIAGVPLTTDVYRHQLAKYATTQLRGYFESVVGYTVADTQRIIPFLPALVAYNNATGLFDATPITDLDEGGPSIRIASPAAGSTITGSSGVDGYVTDIVGVAETTNLPGNSILLVDSNYYDSFTDPYHTNHFINTTVFANGSHTLTIKATNNLGTTASSSVVVNFSN